ncbi:TonB-dependent receptor [Pedobacter arcticus]|uniref:TonB-dependent receptor n=1 Tax=Pedobacter arcticus TaxID=752140 RepID=UPI000366BA75|nr:TonB-dependent receptor [Pedobacter arcticus]
MLSFFSLITTAQNFSKISGQVKDQQGSMVQVSVQLKELAKSTQTDKDGKFVFENLKAGNYTLIVSYIGYQTLQKKVSVQTGEVLNLTLMLEESSTQMQMVTVIGKTKTQELRESGFAVNTIETKQFANTNTNLSQLLNKSTGVKVREKGGVGSDFEFSINGLSGKQIKFFIDGIPLEILGTAMSFNNIPVNLAESIEVYKGVVPVSLGSDALGGAVNIITNRNTKNYVDFSTTYGSFNTNKNALSTQFVDKKNGLTLRLNGFTNYSDNNYKMIGVRGITGDNIVGNKITIDGTSEFITLDAERFHNRYKSAFGQAEVGVSNKSYADALFANFSYTGFDQQLQTGTDQRNVYGMATRHGHSLNAGLRYSKRNLFVKGLDANTYWGYSKDISIVTDTARRKYYWNNIYAYSDSPEMGSFFTINNLTRPHIIGRTNVSYKINNEHSFNLNYVLDGVENNTFNELVTTSDDNPGLVRKNIVGLAYQQDLFSNKWSNVFFTKYYGLGLKLNKYSSATAVYENISSSDNSLGYGLSSRYYVIKDFGVKFSFEKAYRLQEASEMFGDGVNTIANLDLKPEHSYNLNLGTFYSKTLNHNHQLFIEANGFLRYAKDFIYAKVYQSNTPRTIYENLDKINISGAEAEIRYNYKNLLSATVNASYQKSISFSSANSTSNENTYNKRLPNQPWFFGNADLGIGKNDLIGKDTRIQFNWSTNFIHWYYRTWEGLGAVIDDIPSQTIHNASLTSSFQKSKYNISLECNNLTNQLAYDNFKLQKEGRAFYVKLRYFISKN